MSQAKRLGLDDGLDFDQPRRPSDLGQHGLLAPRLQRAFQHQVFDEMRDDAVLARGGDDHQPFGAGGGRLGRHQLDAGRVDNR